MRQPASVVARLPTVRKLLIAGVMAGALSLGLTAATADAATSDTYKVSKTFGPYRGDLPSTSPEPGAVPDGEALTISCRTDRYPFGDNILKGEARVNRKTSHGKTSREVLRLRVIGTGWDPESDRLYYGAFVEPTGKKGWNSVTLTVTCLKG